MFWVWRCTDAVQKWILIQTILYLFTYTKDYQTFAQITSTPETLEITRGPSDELSPPHEPCSLHCVASRGDARISWRYTRDNKRPTQDSGLVYDELRKQLANGTLYIERVDATTEGYYQCVATVDGLGTIVSRVARIKYATLSDLVLEEENREISAPAGAGVLLVCGVNTPYAVWRATRLNERLHAVDVQVDWIKNSVIIPLEPTRMTLTPSGGLEIDPVRPADNGLYSCNVSIPGTNFYRMSGKIELNVNPDLNTPDLGAPRFIATPKSVTVIEGSSVTFDCAAVGNPKPDITWLSNGVAIDLNNLDSRLYVVGGGSLRAVGVRLSDAVSYTCRASNFRDSVDQTATLTVLSPPRITKSSKAVFASLRGSGTLVCEAKGRPPPQMFWYKDGEPLNTNTHDLTVLPPSTLRIQGVLAVDAGMFQCIAENDVGNAQAATRFIVTQDEEPASKSKSNRKKYQTESSESLNELNPKKILKSLKTTYTENVPFEYKEMNTKKSKHNVPNSHLLFNSLVSDINPEQTLLDDYADYFDNATQIDNIGNVNIPNIDNVNMVESQDDLTMNDAELSLHAANFEDYDLDGNSTVFKSAPANLTAVIVKHRFTTLSWEPPEGVDPSEITNYSILYHVKGSQRESLQRVRGTAREANVPSLSPGTTYVFTVRAHNQFGSSPSTDAIEVRTPEEAIIWGPPSGLLATALTPHSVRIRWDQPASVLPPDSELSESGPPKNYQIVWSEVSHETSPQSAWSPESPFVIGSLRADTEYKIQVSAIDGATAEVTVKTLNDAPALPPFNVTASPHSPNSIIVRWQPPPLRSHRGALTGYKIRYRPVQGSGKRKADSVTTAADAKSAIVKGLQNGMQYQFRVCAINANGSGPFSEWVTSHTADTTLDETRVPGQPPPLTTRSGKDWISVWWSAEVTDGVLVRGYSLGWGLGVPDEYTVSTGNTNYIVRGLKSGAEYVISLRALNDLGPGPPVYATVRTHDLTEDEDEFDDYNLHLEDEDEDFEESEMATLIPPIGLKVIMLSGTTAVIYWTDSTLNKGQTATDGRRYVVRWSAVGAMPQKYKYFNATDLNCIVDELRPYTTYEFAVKLYKDGRESEWSMVVTNTTLESPPGLPPRDVTVKPDGPRSLTVRWQPPLKPNGIITGYVIMYTLDSRTDWAAVTVGADKRSHKLAPLRPSTAYTVKMQAKNSKGYGSLSQPIVASTSDELTDPQAEQGTSPTTNNGATNGGWLWAACGGAVAVLCGAAALTVAACCRKQTTNADRSTYQKSAATAAIKPPDLWIHHDQMELKQIDKSHHSSSAASLDQASALVSSTLTLPRGGSTCVNAPGVCPAVSGVCTGSSGVCTGSSGVCSDYDGSKYHGSLDKRHYVPTYVAGSYCSEETARASPSLASSSGYSGRNQSLYDCKPMSAMGACVNYSRTPRPMLAHPEQATPLLSGGNLGSPQSSLHSQPVQCSGASCGSCSGGELYAAVSRGQYVAYEPLGHYTHRSSISGESSVPCGSLQRRNTGTLTGTLPGTLAGNLPGNLHSFGNNSDGSVNSTPTHQGAYSSMSGRGNSPYSRRNTGSLSSSPNRLNLGPPVESSASELNPLTTSRSTERLNREMANLEGLMRDLTDITKNQLNC